MVAEWLDTRLPSNEELLNIGLSLQAIGSAKRFTAPLKRYFSGIGRRYQKFRAERRKTNNWYSGEFAANEVSPLEIDLVLLAILRTGRSALEDITAIAESPGAPHLSLPWRRIALLFLQSQGHSTGFSDRQ